MKADFTGSVKPGSELAPPLTDDIACLGLIGSVLTSRIQEFVSWPQGHGPWFREWFRVPAPTDRANERRGTKVHRNQPPEVTNRRGLCY